MKIQLNIIFESPNAEYMQPLPAVAKEIYSALIEKALSDYLLLVVKDQSLNDLVEQLNRRWCRRAIIHNIDELVKREYLIREHQFEGCKGQKKKNRYYLHARIEKKRRR